MSETPYLDKILALSAGGKLKQALRRLAPTTGEQDLQRARDREAARTGSTAASRFMREPDLGKALAGARKPTPARDKLFGRRETPEPHGPEPRGGLTWDDWREQQGGPGGFDNSDPVAYQVDRELGGRTRDYTRVEHGREERVSGHALAAHMQAEHGWSASDVAAMSRRGLEQVHNNEHNYGRANHRHG